jgi:hypothetical protein
MPVKKTAKKRATKKVAAKSMQVPLSQTIVRANVVNRGFKLVNFDERTKVESWGKDEVHVHIGPKDVSIEAKIIPYSEVTGEYLEFLLK